MIVGRQKIVVVIAVHVHPLADLLHLADARGSPRPIPRLIQRRQQHCGKNRDDRYHYEQFNKSEIPSLSHDYLPFSVMLGDLLPKRFIVKSLRDNHLR